jgi:L-alanine-DL-glutamate epimerase-like enolase superfamily enzyme
MSAETYTASARISLIRYESYPDLFQPYGGFPDSVKVEDGHIIMPELPGIGFEGSQKGVIKLSKTRCQQRLIQPARAFL